MENRDDATVPAQSASKVKGRDFEPVPTTTVIQPDNQASGSPPYDIDPAGCDRENGETH